MEIYREEVYKRYMDWVDKVSEDCDWKTSFGPEEIVNAICDILEKNPMLVKPTFVPVDDINSTWLSPVRTERESQEAKLIEIFGHYPNASPKWQYMNGLIDLSLNYIRIISDNED